MKRNLLCVLAFLGFAAAASAQTGQGSWMVGGNLNLNTPKENTVIQFTPMAGYFIINNFAVGANVDLDYNKSATGKTTSVGIGPFARYYFGTMNIRPFLHGQLDFTSRKDTSTVTGTNYLLGVGLAAFINRNVALEGLAGYSHAAYIHQPGSGGFALRIGFQVYLSRAQVATLKSNL